VLLLLSAIAALGVFLLFLTMMLTPVSNGQRIVPEDVPEGQAPQVAVSGQTEEPAEAQKPPQKTVPVPKETPPPKEVLPPKEALSPKETKVQEPPLQPLPPPAEKTPEPTEIPALPALQATPSPPASSPQKTLIFVIDDAGHNLRQLEPFLALPFPVSIAVLPGLEYSVTAAENIRNSGKELLLHQPMQAQNLAFDPGPGAITGSTETADIAGILEKNLNEVGPVAGLNNHEGSLITANAEAMGAVLEFCQQKGLFFLDSRTTAQSAAKAEAEKRGIHIWERTVFLDNIQEKASIIASIYAGMKIADTQGSSIMIGHVWSNELADILHEMYPELVEQGYSLSAISRMALTGEDDEYPWN
jgi:polysaccharide deacetylase 2 family uncharacterized protein YibQ